MTIQNLPKTFANTLLDILLQVPALTDPDNRERLLRDLPSGPVGTLRRSPAWQTDVEAIVTAVAGWGQLASGAWALVVLAENALRLCQGLRSGVALEVLLATVTEKPKPAKRPTTPTALPADLQQALQSTSVWMREGAVTELGVILQGRDEALATAALEALEGLAADDSRRVSDAAARALGRAAERKDAKIVNPEDYIGRGARASSPPERKPSPAAAPSITQPIHLDLIHVPAGEFLMGSDPAKDKKAKKEEQRQHKLYLPEFYIGKYPVTNGQYGAFVRATRYKSYGDWQKGKFPLGDKMHPAVYVTWDDAVAFCRWLSQERGHLVRLPTEAEWEKAARGPEGLIWPWGNTWDKTRANTKEAELETTTPVGRYSPAGDSPYGAADMAGNVWEWCATKAGGDWRSLHYKPYPYDVTEDEWTEAYLGGRSVRTLRGGSWHRGQERARCGARNGGDWSYLNLYFGFRVAVAPIPSAL